MALMFPAYSFLDHSLLCCSVSEPVIETRHQTITNQVQFMRFEIPSMLNMKTTLFWDVMHCGLVGTSCQHLQVRSISCVGK